MPLECFKLTLEYDGTRYHGWQSQKNSRTIQDALIAAAREVLQVDVDLGGAGRTDAGVHALAQVAHLKFRVSSSESPYNWSRVSGPGFRVSSSRSRVPSSEFRVSDSRSRFRAKVIELETRDPEPETRDLFLRDQLNHALPSDIVVLSVEQADANFHARHDAVRRYYLYQVANRKTAFAKKYIWWVKEPLNLAAMQHAAGMLLGRHDFAAFGEKGGERKSTLVEVYECSLNATEELILIRIGASHFLWKMVRRLVGSLVEIGRGNLSQEAFAEMLEHRKGSAAPFTAPASGLFLQKVTYSEEEQPGELSPVMWV